MAPPFRLVLTNQAKEQLAALKKNRALNKRYNAAKKTLKFLAANPRHPGLNTHEFTSLKGPNGEKIFEAYVEQRTPAAYRVFWFYGHEKDQITIVTITPHP